MKKTISLIVLLILVVMSFSSCGLIESVFLKTKTVTVDGVIYEKTSTFGKYSVMGLEDKSITDLVIPESIKRVSVNRIGPSAFRDCDNLKSVTIPDSVSVIDQCAFEGCENLESIVIPNGVTRIPMLAFRGCTSLTSVVLPEGLVSIGLAAFQNCSALKSITIPSSVTKISDGGAVWFQYFEPAFHGCRITEVINHSSLNIVAGSSDNGEVALYAKKVHAGDSENVNYNNYLFYTYNNVNYLIDYVGSDTDIMLPESYNGQNYEIAPWAFSGYTHLTSIEIPNSVTSIGFCAFSNCKSLKNIVIPNSVTNLGNSVFYNCKALTSIVIPDSVTSIDISTFSDCASLTEVYYTGTEGEWSEISIASDNEYLTGATRYYYSETEPTTEGNFWRYVDGVPTPW